MPESSIATANSNQIIYPKASTLLLVGGVLGFLSTLFILFAFCCPYWLEAYTDTNNRYANQFISLGLWEACFDEFRFPRYQFTKSFTGCHNMYSEEYRIIREWILPGWLILIQALMSFTFLFGLGSLCCISCILMRYYLKYEWWFIVAANVFQGICGFFAFLSVLIFGIKCWDRSWLLYPNYNHLSWAYAFAVVGMFFHIFSAVALYFETFRARERKRRVNNLMYKMDVSPSASYRY